jgi:hypothetical protein
LGEENKIWIGDIKVIGTCVAINDKGLNSLTISLAYLHCHNEQFYDTVSINLPCIELMSFSFYIQVQKY